MAQGSRIAELGYFVLVSDHLQMLGVLGAAKQVMPTAEHSQSFSVLLLLPPLRLQQLLQQPPQQPPHQLHQPSHWDILGL